MTTQELAQQILAWIRSAEKLMVDIPDSLKHKPLEGLTQDIKQLCQEEVSN